MLVRSGQDAHSEKLQAQYTKEEIEEILADVSCHVPSLCATWKLCAEKIIRTFTLAQVPRDEKGRMDFSGVRKVVNETRASRIEDLRKMYPPVKRKKVPPPTYKASRLTTALMNKKLGDPQVDGCPPPFML